MSEQDTSSETSSDPSLAADLCSHLEFSERNLRLAQYIVRDLRGSEYEAKLYVALAWYGIACFYARSKGEPTPSHGDFTKSIPFEELDAERDISKKSWEEDLKRYYRESDGVPLTRMLEGSEEIKLLQTHMQLVKRCLKKLKKGYLAEHRSPRPERYLPRELITAASLFFAIIAGYGVGIVNSPSQASSSASLDPSVPVVGSHQLSPAPWLVHYFGNKDLSGEPLRVGVAANIDLEGQSSFHAPELPENNYSIRWESCLMLSEDTDFKFLLTSDDGSRLFINGESVADLWGEHATWTREYRTRLKAGVHHIRVDYFEGILVKRVALKASIQDGPMEDLPLKSLRIPEQSGNCEL